MPKKDFYYLINYRDPKDGKILSLKARQIEDSSLGLSFVRISEFIFDTSHLVVQPTEEQLQKKFEDVKSFHLSIYSILSIEEKGLENTGLKFTKDKSNLLVMQPSNPGSTPTS